MTARLVHGMLLGVLFALVAAFLELSLLFSHYPYHRDWGVLADWLPAYLLVGSLSGLAAALLVKHISLGDLHSRNAGLALGSLLLPIWIAAAIALSSPQGMLTGLPIRGPLGVVTGALAWLILSRFSLSSMAWVASGFLTPWFAGIGSAICVVAVLALDLRPLSPAPGTPQPSASHFGEATDALPPNILLIVLDGVRADHLGCYGANRPVSPTLDALANQGVVCSSAFATAPWTIPSHASIQTGLHPNSHGAGWARPRLVHGRSHANPTTLAEALAARAFQTCGVSNNRWLTAHRGLTQGFAQYYDFASAQLDERLLLPRLIDRCSQRFFGKSWIRQPQADKGGRQIVGQALQWLQDERDPTRPFFVSLNLREATPAFTAPSLQADFARFLPQGFELDELDEAYFGSEQLRWQWNARARSLLNQEADVQTALYDASIAYQDELLGDLVDGLLDMQLMENTLMIVTSSHGDEFNEQGRFGPELSLSDRTLHVPLVFRLPSSFPAQGRIDSLVSAVDIAPTVLSFVDSYSVTPPTIQANELAMEGFSLLDALRGTAPFERDWILASTDNPTPHLAQYPEFGTDDSFALAQQSLRSITMLRSGTRKYFRYGDGNEALLDLATDPHEGHAETLEIDPELEVQVSLFRHQLNRILNQHTVRRALLQGPGSGTRPIEFLERTLPRTRPTRFSNPRD